MLTCAKGFVSPLSHFTKSSLHRSRILLEAAGYMDSVLLDPVLGIVGRLWDRTGSVLTQS